jgi:hypothetical protein
MEFVVAERALGQVCRYRIVGDIGVEAPDVDCALDGIGTAPDEAATDTRDTTATDPCRGVQGGCTGVAGLGPARGSDEETRDDRTDLVGLQGDSASTTPPGEVSATLRVASYQQQATGPSAVHHGVSG